MRIRERLNSEVQNRELGTFSLENSSVSVHGLHFMVCAPLIFRSESVKCRFSKCRFSVLNLKFDFISDGGCTREKQIQKALGSLPPCGNRCRFSESAICSSRVHPPSEIKSNFKFKTLRWRPLRWRLTLSDSRLFSDFWGFGLETPSESFSQAGEIPTFGLQGPDRSFWP